MSTTTIARPKLSMATTWRQGLTAAAIAAVINTVLYVAGSALGGFPADVITPMGTPITLVAVILASIAPLLVGTLVYTLLYRWTTNPNRWFMILAILVLLAFVPGPLTLPKVTNADYPTTQITLTVNWGSLDLRSARLVQCPAL